MSSPAIPKKYLSTSYGDIAYLETGAPPRPPILLVHGIPTSSYLWRHVLRFLQHDFHCYAPDLMGLGDTEVDPQKTCFHMEAQAEMLLEFMAKQGHEQFGLICHDQGGAAAQIIAARLPHRITCFGITDCVCYDNWPVPAIKRLQHLSRLPLFNDALSRTGIMQFIQDKTPLSDFRRGVYERDKLSSEAIAEYLRPLRHSPLARERMRRFILAGHPRYTQGAVAGLERFDKPTIVVWAADDYYLSPSWGKKLFEDIPGAEGFELVPFCGHFWQEERPAEFAGILGEFFARHLLRPKQEKTPKQPSPLLPVAPADPTAEGD